MMQPLIPTSQDQVIFSSSSFKFMIHTLTKHDASFIKRSSAKSWTRSWLDQSQDSAKHLRQRKKKTEE